ncbi:uncharacterized protein LOC112180846 isoform X1 [Rosa chinensis]|uniref:uncharacterized protein LOC112180846 isoform X1 n=2 Tax=Rosa chinensis TaxID=74649 RepID=UPI000D091B90|nr:uncharacterized protein LOC112180846 isoform X1 [Rosa chinensis]
MAMQKCVLKLPGLCARSKFRSGLLSKQIPQLKLHGTRALSEEGLRGLRSLKPTSASGSSQEHPLSLMETEYEKLRVEMKKMHSELVRHISESVKSNTSRQQEHKFSKMEFESDKVQKNFQNMISDEIGEKFNKISQELAALGAEIKVIHNQTQLCSVASACVIGAAVGTTLGNL